LKYFLTAAILVVVLGLGAILYAWSGVYSIAATEPHWAATSSFISMVRDRSIAVRSDSIDVPDMDDPQYRQAAFSHYHGMCRLCHGAPGYPVNEFARGLYPAPPDMRSGGIQKARSEAELYWIVKHGLKMTGMPAFGPTHDETELWGLVALVAQMPGMVPARYAQGIEAAGVGRETGGGHVHEASHEQKDRGQDDDAKSSPHVDEHEHD
jgi:mono/diheme cytochrome c family protein